MKHSFQKVLCLLIAVTMLLGLLPVGLFVSAADVVVLGADGALVDDDFSAADNGKTVQATIAGTVYQAVMGTNAFTTINDAAAAIADGGDVYVAPGVYRGATVSGNIGLYGAGMNVNPNNSDWTLNASRANPENESIITSTIDITARSTNKLIINGFSFTGLGRINEGVDDATVTNAGYDIIYNYYHDTQDFSSTKGAIWLSNSAKRTGYIRYNRIEDPNSTAKPITMRNLFNFTFEGNYMETPHDIAIWASAEVKDQSTLAGLWVGKVIHNYLKSAAQAVSIALSYAEDVDIDISGNTIESATAIYIAGGESTTVSKSIRICDNDLIGGTADISFDGTTTDGTAKFMPDLFEIHGNILRKGVVSNKWTADDPLDLSYNYFGADTPDCSGTPKPIIYPRYKDETLTDLIGEMTLGSVRLTGVMSDDSEQDIADVIIDNDARSVTVDHAIDPFASIRIEAVPNETESEVTGYYSDPRCTQKLTNGVLDNLRKGLNVAYIKLTTSLDNYSYKIYTLNLNRNPSAESKIIRVDNYTGAVNEADKSVSLTIPSADFNPNIQLVVSNGATYTLYSDASCRHPISGTVVPDLPAGTTTYYVRVTAEDGSNSTDYKLILTRAPSAAAEILSVNAPDFVKFDETEDAYVGVYSSRYEQLTLDLTVSPRATWKLFKDEACGEPADPNEIVLVPDADNIYYVAVSSEADVNKKVYKFIFRSESEETSKEIYGVKNSVLSSEITADSISIALSKTVTEFKPDFDYIGAYWNLFESYADGVLSDPVSDNTIRNLTGGKHTYYVQVTAQDGSTRVYTLIIDRKYSSDAKLTAVNGGSDTYIDRFDYTVTTTVKEEGAFYPSFTVSAGATWALQTTGGATVSRPIMLRTGTSEYRIVVTAEDGTVNTYVWTITCIGSGNPVLSDAVAVNNAWKDKQSGEAVSPVIGGKVYEAYIGETAFASLEAAKSAAASHNGTIYVMSGAVLDEDVTLSSIKLYGANYAINPKTTNRYAESVLTGTITLTGSNGAVSGFTVRESAAITVNGSSGFTFANNIFTDSEPRTESAVTLNRDSTEYNDILFQNNVFNANSSAALISLSSVTGVTFSDNRVTNEGAGAAIELAGMNAGSEFDISGNTFDTTAAAIQGNDTARNGYLFISQNTFIGGGAVLLNAASADDAFLFNFNDNKTNTTAIAVQIENAKASLASHFTANQNFFASIGSAVAVEYAADAAPTEAVDITKNYYGEASPGNDGFDSNYNYKPYYVDEAKKNLSNVVLPVAITANDVAVTDNGLNIYAVIEEETATVTADFLPNSSRSADALGYIFVDPDATTLLDNTETFTVDDKKIAYVTVFSLDMTEREVYEVTLYPKHDNPVYDVYGVTSRVIDGMTVTVVLENRATTWTPSLEIIENKAITLYTDAACKKAVKGAVKLTGDHTTVYGKVAGYDVVTFNIYKKLSDEKAILSIKDAYTLDYTDSDAIDLTVDSRLETADLSATVSAGASYKVFTDPLCESETDCKKVSHNVETLYYQVTAADASVKVFTVSIFWKGDVVDPLLLSVRNATTKSFKGNNLIASISKYNAKTGFNVNAVVNTGCTVKLYADAAHEYLVKNNTIRFPSNYVIFYAVVTSLDGVKTNEYTIRLEKPAAKFEFADAIPNWAKAAVRATKDLGIVNGDSTKEGVILDANGNTTREMMACFIIRMLGVDDTQYFSVDLSEYYTDYEDVSSWALNSMKAATALGIFTGSEEGDEVYLYAKNNITRQEFAAVFVRATKTEGVAVNTFALPYKDASSVASWAKNYVKIVTKLGYMKGDKGYFYPKNNITRAEIIQTIANYLKK